MKKSSPSRPENENPFRVTSSREIYENPWIRVVEHAIINPAGKSGIYGVVSYKNRAVGVIPYFDNGEIVLVGQYRFPLKQYSWEIPEGGSPAGEELLSTARRELKEETGFEAESFEPIVEMHLSNSVSDEYAIVYLARGLKSGEAQPEDTEELRLKRVSLDWAYAEVSAGRITDSMTVAGVLKLVLMKREGRI